MEKREAEEEELKEEAIAIVKSYKTKNRKKNSDDDDYFTIEEFVQQVKDLKIKVFQEYGIYYPDYPIKWKAEKVEKDVYDVYIVILTEKNIQGNDVDYRFKVNLQTRKVVPLDDIALGIISMGDLGEKYLGEKYEK